MMLGVKTKEHLWIIYITTIFNSLTHTIKNILIQFYFIYF
jgi:hypothetical protein